jgi:hypothetical protein
MCKIRFLSLFAVLALLFSFAGTALPAYADKGQPPVPPLPRETPPDGVTVTVEESTTTVQGPDGQERQGHIQPNGVLPGPSGQSGNLSSILSYYQSGSWWEQGTAKITLNSNNRMIIAKAWTTLKANGVTQQTTAANPCWASGTSGTPSCTSSTKYWAIWSGTGENKAETVITWYDNSNGYGTVTASHTF